jgi:Fe-S cluster assembly ATP-binding protein
MIKKLLEISNLEVSIGEKKIINNFNLVLNENEIHLIMGPNGSGKSTLSRILAGHESYVINNGTINFLGEDLLTKEINIRAQSGLFLAFQYPLEILGITNYDFLREIYNQQQKHLKKIQVNSLEFMEILKPFLQLLKINSEFLNRNVNESFSGGEKKRNEILQMLLLNPKLLILDEIDSGLDLDAIRLIYKEVLNKKNYFKKETSILIISHNPKILNYITPNYVHIMVKGEIIKTGNIELVNLIEEIGYEKIINNHFKNI